jgi:HlyD family secretion protein
MKKVILFLLVIMVAAGGFFFFESRKGNSIAIDTTTVKKGDLVKSVSSTGTLEAVNTVDVGAQVSGTIKTIYVDYNSVVRKGDLLAEIDPSLLSAKVKQSKADVLAAKADVQEAQANVRNAKKTRDRNKELFSRNLIAESDLDSAQTDYETSLAKLTSARANLALAEADLEYDETNLGYTEITSPIDGVVTDRAVDEGQTVNSSQSAPTLFTIAEDLTEMQVETDVDEADIGQVKGGQVVEFTVDAYPELSFSGKVDEIRLAPTTSDNVVSYTVIVEVANPDLKLMPGMTANVSIISDKKEGVFKVASSALKFQPAASLVEMPDNAGAAEGAVRPANRPGKGFRQGGSAGSTSPDGPKTLWVYENGKLKPIPVKTGISDGMYTEVSGNLSEGLEVVTAMTGVEDSKKGGSPFGFGPRR